MSDKVIRNNKSYENILQNDSLHYKLISGINRVSIFNKMKQKQPRKNDPQRSPDNMVLAVSFPRDLVERLDRVCDAEDITRSQLVRKLARKYLEDRESGRNTFLL